MDSILSIRSSIMNKARNRRKSLNFSQIELSKRSGVSLGSVKRFENTGEISLTSLLKIAIALECEDEFNKLFLRKNYQSLQEIINESE